MKITIDLEELFSELQDSEGTIKEMLVKNIIGSCVYQISAAIKKQVEDQIQREVKNAIESSMLADIRKEVARIIPVAMISIGKQEEVTLEEYIRTLFSQKTGWNSPNDYIEKLSKQFGDEMKKRYDMLFATQIVNKMAQNGLLKEGMETLLLEKK